MNSIRLIGAVSLLCLSSTVLSESTQLSAQDQAAAFTAAGFKLQGTKWRACVDDLSPAYSAGVVEDVRDANGDGLPEAVLSEGGTYCHGHTGAGYSVVSKQANGSWKLMTRGTGMIRFLATKGVGGWPDIEIGGPGFCFPVARWNGREYAVHRHQYEGKPCRKN